MKHLESLAADEFAVCDAVLTETCIHLPHRNQRQRLRALLHDLSVQPIPVMYERDFFLEVLDWLTKYADHEPDWADACVAILSGRDNWGWWPSFPPWNLVPPTRWSQSRPFRANREATYSADFAGADLRDQALFVSLNDPTIPFEQVIKMSQEDVQSGGGRFLLYV